MDWNGGIVDWEVWLLRIFHFSNYLNTQKEQRFLTLDVSILSLIALIKQAARIQ